MSARTVRLLQEDNEIVLENQLDRSKSIKGKLRVFLEEFLIKEEIYSLEAVDDQIIEEYENFVNSQIKLSFTQKKYYKNLITQALLACLVPDYQDLVMQMNAIQGQRALKNKVLLYLMMADVKNAKEIDYDIRSRYCQHNCSAKALEEIKILDRLKLNVIKMENENYPMSNRKLKYDNRKVFLLYYPDYEIGMSFYYIRDKEELLFDFTLNASVRMKQQIFKMLVYVLDEKKKWHDRRERFLIPLKKLYLFCIENHIDDIEQLEAKDIKDFRDSMDGHVGTKTSIYMQIVDNTLKFLFMSAKDVNWDANTWYLERFNLDEGRSNPAREIKSFRFSEIENQDNRRLFKCYMKYEIGISQNAIQTIRGRYYNINNFLEWLDEKKVSVLAITAEIIEGFINFMDSKDLQPEVFNKEVICVEKFLEYLAKKEKINEVPIHIEYYLKNTFIYHRNRMVTEEIQMQILNMLNSIPMHLRLMYLNLWCIGLRISEVCTIKGDNYYWDGEDAWLKLYQNKMRSEKCVPIPHSLYLQMQHYIAENKIGKGEYVFKNRKGGAYDASTFSKQMKRHLSEAGIMNYSFKAHDFRHTVATFLYINGVSIEAIRDYLGHKESDMTKMYLDYLPYMIDAKNDIYFASHGNDFSRYIKKGKENGRKNIF